MKYFNKFIYLIILINLVMFATTSIYYENQSIIYSSSLFYWFSFVVFLFEYCYRIFRHSKVNRIKLIISPIMLIDLLAILSVPFFGIMFNAFFLRMFRLFSFLGMIGSEKEYSPLDLFINAFKKYKEELLITISLILFGIIFISYSVFIIESKAQPDAFSNFVPSFLWSVQIVLGGDMVNIYPITVVGKMLHIVTIFFSVAIVALPVGIIGGGFVEQISEAKLKQEFKINSNLMQEAFMVHNKISERNLLKKLDIITYQRSIPLETINTRIGLSNEDISSTIKYSKCFRMRTMRRDNASNYEDISVVEYFKANKSYGTLINRNSNILIVATQNYSDVHSGHFSYTLASCLNASYISNEYFSSGAPLKDKQVNFSKNLFYTENHTSCAELEEFRNDLELVSNDSSLIIYLGTAGEKRSDIHVLFGGEKGENNFNFTGRTFKNSKKLEPFFSELKKSAKTEFDYSVVSHDEFENTNPEKLSSFIHKSLNKDIISLFINIKIQRYSDSKKYYNTISLIGDKIRKLLV
jgi:voltage-gated potassium channel